MVFNIGGLIFPEDPTTIQRRVIRNKKTNSLLDNFPGFVTSVPQSFAIVFTGIVFPKAFADAVWERLKNAETETVTLEFTDEDWLNGTYSAERVFIDRNSPLFVNNQGNVQKVYKYQIVLGELAGAIQDGDEGGPEEGENTNFFDIPEIAGDELSTEDALNILKNAFTLGALD